MILLYLYAAFVLYLMIGLLVLHIKLKKVEEDRVVSSPFQAIFILLLWPIFLRHKF